MPICHHYPIRLACSLGVLPGLVLTILADTASAQADVGTLSAPPSRPFSSGALTSDAWDFEVGAGTDNRSKTASKSSGDPYAFGEARWSVPGGVFYAATGFETIRSSSGSRLELEASIGLSPEAFGFAFNLDATRKQQVDADAGFDNDAWEFTADASRSIGPASGRLRIQHSPDGTGTTGAWTWVAARAGWAVSPRLDADLEVGRREQDAAVDYTGWNLGLTWAATQDVALDLRWHDTNAHGAGEQYEGALVGTVSLSF